MAAPLLTGRRRVQQRLAGLLFLAVLAGAVGLTVALYQKAFTPVVMVALDTDRVGSQLSKGADVKARGLIVGEVRQVSSNGRTARLMLAIDRDAVDELPSDLRARMIPKTLFGEKIVDLVIDDTSTARPLRDGDLISQDRTETARETSEALDNLLPLLQAIKPADLSTTLNALSGALRGRGDQIGSNLVLVDTYLQGINPELPTLEQNFAGVADLADTFTRTAPSYLEVLDNLSFLSRSLVDQESSLSTFLRGTTTSTRELDSFLQENETRLIRLAEDSLPSLQVYDRYSTGFPCLAKGLVAQEKVASDAFGGLQPGLHITLEVISDNGQYLQGEQPRYGEDSGPTCRGLPPNAPIVPFPADVEVTDGYCDEEEARSPEVATSCRDAERGQAPGFPAAAVSAAAFEPARALARRDQDRIAVNAVVGPVLGMPTADVPDLAVLLFGPMARGTQVGLSR